MTLVPVRALPLAGTFAWWATAWLRGRAVTDLVLDAVGGDGRLHRGAGGETIAELLAGLRAAGATGCGLALPVEGDPLGLGGPRELNTLALEHGEAVVADGGVALVPEVGEEVVTWHRLPAAPRQLPDVGEADRALRRAVTEAADALAALDVARWRPEAADLLLGSARRSSPPAPDGTPARCVDLAGRGLVAEAIVAVALADDGGAVSAAEIGLRHAALEPLGRAARRALVAACSPEVWPPG